jgi:hypothetical protein
MTKGKPWLAKHMKEQGKTLAQYEAGVRIANAVADGIVERMIALHGKDTGMYFPATELDLTDSVEHDFVRVCLKDRGMEFIENGTLYRV